MPKTCFVDCKIAAISPRDLPNNPWGEKKKKGEMESTSYRLAVERKLT